MSVKTIQATIVDIRSDKPNPRDQLFVDTNSWRNLTYSRLTNPKPHYLNYLKRALEEKAALYACGVTLLELASTIETDEWQLFKATSECDKKMFRHQFPDARKKVVSEVRASWDQVKQFATIVDFPFNADAIDRCLKAFDDYLIDGYDSLIFHAMDRRGVRSILTDDSDFATIPDVLVFTANAAVIATARNQKRLVRRS